MPDYRVLDWDSAFFGFAVAQISVPKADAAQLAEILASLREAKVRLAYWAVSSAEGEATRRTAADLGGALVDEKTTFLVDLSAISGIATSCAADVVPCSPATPVAALRSLAIQSGVYSRFAVDPRIPHGKFAELYTIWIERSLRKEIASEVLVIQEGGAVAGMVTVGEKNGRGDIGLVAVDERFRGRGLGETLVRAAQRWFIERGLRYSQVVTQGANRPACRLYSRCGYAVEKVEPYFHFWL